MHINGLSQDMQDRAISRRGRRRRSRPRRTL